MALTPETHDPTQAPPLPGIDQLAADPSITIDTTYLTKSIVSASRNLFQLVQTAPFHIYHVGQTNNPTRRRQGTPYKKVKVNGNVHSGYTRVMYLIYEAPTYQACQNAEAKLIDKLWSLVGLSQLKQVTDPLQRQSLMTASFNKHGIVVGNERAGKAGRIPKTGPYYVYVAVGG